MQTQDDNTDEIIDEIIKHWDDENWLPRMTADEYINLKGNNRELEF